MFNFHLQTNPSYILTKNFTEMGGGGDKFQHFLIIILKIPVADLDFIHREPGDFFEKFCLNCGETIFFLEITHF